MLPPEPDHRRADPSFAGPDATRGRSRRSVPAFMILLKIERRQPKSHRLFHSNAAPTFTGITDEARIVFDNVLDAATGGGTPTVRLGVTGLSRAGKTVFITALVHNLVHGGRLPLFEARASGRLTEARLMPQPDDDVPRFDY